MYALSIITVATLSVRTFSIALPSPLPFSAPEPPARKLVGAVVRMDSPVPHISAARELRDGRILISDGTRAAGVYVLDPRTGSVARIGSAGAGAGQYAQPGGFYSASGDSIFLLDRALRRVLVLTSNGEIVGSRSIARKGFSGSSDADVDLQRVDSRGLAYFTDRAARRRESGTHVDSAPLLRLDPATQHIDTVAKLRRREENTIPAGDRMTFSRAVIGSPADAWGLAPDGRIAVVRAVPYRVDWISRDGRVTRGPVIPYDALPMTDEDRKAATASQEPGPSVGQAGGARVDANGLPTVFASVKPPFEMDGVVVSPDGRVWVARTRPAAARTVVFDVFDSAGKRIDRVELPAGSRLVGFGRDALLVADTEDGKPLRRYPL